jgi:hypothetical protein
MLTKEQKLLILTILSGFYGRSLVLSEFVKMGVIERRTIEVEEAIRDFLVNLKANTSFP